MCKSFNIRAAQQSTATDISVCYRSDSTLPFTHLIDFRTGLFARYTCVCVCLCTCVCRLTILRQFLMFYRLQCHCFLFPYEFPIVSRWAGRTGGGGNANRDKTMARPLCCYIGHQTGVVSKLSSGENTLELSNKHSNKLTNALWALNVVKRIYKFI